MTEKKCPDSFQPDLADAPRGRVGGRRRGRRFHSCCVILRATDVRRAASPVEGLPFQQGLQTAAVHTPQCITLQAQLQICCTHQAQQ